jgi:hypothetical protein
MMNMMGKPIVMDNKLVNKCPQWRFSPFGEMAIPIAIGTEGAYNFTL